MRHQIAALVLALLTLASTTAPSRAQDRPASATLTIRGDGKLTISRHIYGHFTEHLGRCIYDGIWVGKDSPVPHTGGLRNDVVAALAAIKIPNLRWPGGCFADYYHWRTGIGPAAQRPRMYNDWGAVDEDNSFGTHEFMRLIELTGAEAYICGNMGTGSPQEMAEWNEYLTLDGDTALTALRKANGRSEPWKVGFWAVGNENWGCGGNMTPEHYADLYRQYATYLRNYSGNKLFRVACGQDLKWNEVILQKIPLRMLDGISIHHYTVPGGWRNKESATEFDEGDWFECLSKAGEMERILLDNEQLLDKYDERKRIALIVDEWGTWFKEEPGTHTRFLYQQNTLRDALVAGLTLNIFNQHCERVKMANIAQTVNVLQAMILTQGEKMLLTPSYHVFALYAPHQDATLLPLELDAPKYNRGDAAIPQLSASASKSADGQICLTLCNLHPQQPVELHCTLENLGVKTVSGQILTAEAMNAHNTFEQPEQVKIAPFDSAKLAGQNLNLTLPPKSVVALLLAQ